MPKREREQKQEEQRASVEPKVSRPRMPEGYGIPKGKKGMLEWSRVDEALAKAPTYWLSTASPDGEPHATPIWGAWVGMAVYFDGAPTTRWGRNLAANPRIVVHIEAGDVMVMLQGSAEIVTPEPEAHGRIAEQYGSKYPYKPEAGGQMYMVRPSKAFAWDNNDFGKTATRWRFDAIDG